MKNITNLLFVIICTGVIVIHIGRIIYTASGHKLLGKFHKVLSIQDKKIDLIVYYVLAIYASYKAAEYAYLKVVF